jgi:hypothetical protein
MLLKSHKSSLFIKPEFGTAIALIHNDRFFIKTEFGNVIALIQHDRFNKLHRVCQQILTELLVCFHFQQI